MPEYNLLDHRKIFGRSDAAIGGFFTSHTDVFYIDAKNTIYKNFSPRDLEVSKYDGHPNERAHRILADSLIAAMPTFFY
jgi:hypothetical protein